MSYFQRPGIPAVRGSLFGEPVDYFECMNISPPKTPPVRATTKTLPPPLPLLDPLAPSSSASASTGATSATAVVAVFPRWLHEDALRSAALMIFATAPTPLLVQTTPRAIRIEDPVRGYAVDADGCFWQRLLYYDGSRGHCFTLTHGGEVATKIEVQAVDGAPRELVHVHVVQANHSSLAVDGGIVPPSTSLAFDAPDEYLHKMEALHAQMEVDSELVYVPTSELIVTDRLFKIPLRVHTAGHATPESVCAREVWQATKSFLRKLSDATEACCAAHLAHEERRAGSVLGRQPVVESLMA